MKIAASVVLSLLFGATWAVLLGRPGLRRTWWWLVAAGGALGVPLTLAVQPPAQRFLASLILGYWVARPAAEYAAGTAAVIVSGFVQEFLKLVPVAALIWGVWHRRPAPGNALAAGAASGLGFGVCEAAFIIGSAWVKLGTVPLVGLVERFFAIMFHGAVTAAAAWGLAAGRAARYYLLASGWHALLNFTALLVGMWLIGVVQAEIIVAAVSLAVLGWALFLRSRDAAPEEKRGQGRQQGSGHPQDKNAPGYA